MKVQTKLMASLLCLILAAGLWGCSDSSRSSSDQSSSDEVSLWSNTGAVIIPQEIKNKLKASKGSSDINTVQQGLNLQLEESGYNPSAQIELDLHATGGWTSADLLKEVQGIKNWNYSAIVVMGCVADAMQDQDPKQALNSFAGSYGKILDILKTKGVPVVVCELPPLVDGYQREFVKQSNDQINSTIKQMNQIIYTLGMDNAQAIVFINKVFASHVNKGPASYILNETHGMPPNGLQPSVEGMRVLSQLIAQGVHRAGYRNGRILLLGDTYLDNKALTRQIDQSTFLIKKYLEIELNVP